MDDNAGRDYTVTGQNQTRVYNQSKELVDAYEIFYSGPNSITGSVKVPVANATPDYVDSLIRQALTQQLRIAQLGTR